MLSNHLYIIHGDITQLSADAITYSTSSALRGDGQLFASFRDRVPGFVEAYEDLRRSTPQRNAGQAFWVPLEIDRLKGVIVSVSTGKGQNRRKLVWDTVENAIHEAAQRLTKPPEGKRLLVALPCFLLGAGGGGSQRVALAKIQVAAAAAALKKHSDLPLDIVVVAYTRSLYHLFLEARRSLPAPPSPIPHTPALQELEAAIQRKECVLFVGAGTSSGAGVASWTELNCRMEQDLSLQNTDRKEFEYSLDLAQWYRDAFPEEPNKLRDLIREIFGRADAQKKPTLDHYLLMALDTPYVITTNYDQLLERTLHALRKPFQAIYDDDQVSQAGSHHTCLVKIHGDTHSSNDVVLSRDDYDHFFQKHPALSLLLEGLLLHRTFLFVGYSLRDADFRQLYSRIELMLKDTKRPAYATSFDNNVSATEQALRQKQWERKRLFLIPFSGDKETQKALLRRWLDHLADTAIKRESIFLAEGQGEDDTPQELTPLRTALFHAAHEVERICAGPMTQNAAKITSKVLSLLTDLGWRPSNWSSLSKAWVRLAFSFPDKSVERQQLLRVALEYTDHSADAAAIERMIKNEA